MDLQGGIPVRRPAAGRTGHGISGVLLFTIKPFDIIDMLLTLIILVWLGIYLIRNPEPNLE